MSDSRATRDWTPASVFIRRATPTRQAKSKELEAEGQEPLSVREGLVSRQAKGNQRLVNTPDVTSQRVSSGDCVFYAASEGRDARTLLQTVCLTDALMHDHRRRSCKVTRRCASGALVEVLVVSAASSFCSSLRERSRWADDSTRLCVLLGLLPMFWLGQRMLMASSLRLSTHLVASHACLWMQGIVAVRVGEALVAACKREWELMRRRKRPKLRLKDLPRKAQAKGFSLGCRRWCVRS